MNNEFAPRKAEKKRVKLKMAVQGPSGSGKTWGALALAKNLWPDAKVCLIDTENESASLYAGSFTFDTIPLSPPFTTARYVQCVDAVVKAGYDVLIIDTITAQWDGNGGILRRKEELERRSPGVNGYTLWAQFTPEHEAFKQVILQSPLHVICTMRSKQEYALQQNEKGKLTPVKMGLAPIQRDQMDYEFTLVFDVNMMHGCAVSKDRTGLFDEKSVNLADPKTADAIRGWLESGVPQNSSAEPDLPSEVQTSPQPAGAPHAPPPVQPVTQPPAAPQTASQGQDLSLWVSPDKLLHCVVKGIVKKKGDKGEFLSVSWHGTLDGFGYAFCYHNSLHEAVNASLDKRVVLKVLPSRAEDGKKIRYFTIEDVMEVAGVPYDLGKPSFDTTTGEVIDGVK